jgi:hypothetical protein
VCSQKYRLKNKIKIPNWHKKEANQTITEGTTVQR